jgi:hypothetical protein
MADWQRTLWKDIAALDDVVPHAGAYVLVVGNGLPVVFEGDVRVRERDFGEAMGEDAGFHRIIILARGGVVVDYPLLLKQMWPLLRPDGFLVLVTARPNPWGLRGSVWWHGFARRHWLRWLKEARWLVADDETVGFSSRWVSWMPCGGPVRVFLAQKRVGGAKLLAREGDVVKAKPVGVPV